MSENLVAVDKAATILKLLGDKTRLMMVKLLENNTCCVCEFVEIFQTSQPAISQHLRKLRDIGVVMEERKGQWIFYSLNKNYDHYSLVEQILQQVPNQEHKLKELEENGTRISCC
ncbi:winged helix-turn-helix transcriptional regulator [Gracilibacillus oryzae]|uniref:Winged helix-turn-helix transcriptional regulator n=1 Tax=Gracilibacillus oryzae TaxID=1672701 RepID=A0A7C8GTW4_9BACI|nr:metalloregulator ArsR/SmtB family transcription factor [Gracilibacillus oryzae]KAB8137755.1 winged helix-turn-helix transcriptional regulator [Gracilibacillus oryzae]